MYQIWLFNSSGDKVAVLEKALNIRRGGKINETPWLSFSYPNDADNAAKAALITTTYTVKVWNTKKSRFEGLYDLGDTTEKWDGSGSLIEAYYTGAMGRLLKEDNVTYDTTATPKTPTQIITALLALQEHSPAITVGTIEPTTSFAFAVENTNILNAVLKCAEYLGGRIEVDDTGALNWYNTATIVTREIRYQKNLKAVTRKRDFSKIYNKVYAYGYGETEAQVTLLDAEEAHEYIEDATSQAAYGVQIKRITDKRITHPSTLLRWAQLFLATYKDPVYSYTVDMVNLAEHPAHDFDLENIEVGQIVRVVNSDMNNLSVDVEVVSVETNLSDAKDITVELATVTKDISNSFSDVAQYQDIAKNMAVQIGAGQVTVQGTFTVDGWRTTGQTTIDGGNITAGTITAAKLTITPVVAGGAAADVNANVTTIEGGKITADTITCDKLTTSTLEAKVITVKGSSGALKSDNYAAGSAGWQIDGAGNAEFNNVTVRGTIATATISSGGTLTVSGTMKSENFNPDSPYAGWSLDGSGGATFKAVSVKGSINITGDVSAVGEVSTQKQLSLAGNVSDANAPVRSLYTNDGKNLLWKKSDGTIRTIVTS